eukprot:TRINITY_DN22316_c0_g1_i2.p1 TRINITY_DN22316_c0_g1~~TRINITY_DN22316_c0_g1_i2.p1  ORF type:complete len:282 (+),score=31.43 TRINITY_DN22316_c0_g1_i2:64-909(+)
MCIRDSYYKNMSERSDTTETDLIEYDFKLKVFMAAGLILLLLFFILVALVIFLRKFFDVSATLLGVSAGFVVKTPSIVVFPLFILAILLVQMIFFIVVGLFLYSSGEVDRENLTNTPFAKTKLTGTTRFFLGFNIFFCFWNLVFNIGFTEFVISSAACLWYYKENGEEGSAWEMETLKSLYRGYRFHPGSVALGSLILSFVWILRWIVNVIEWILNKANSSRNRILVHLSDCLFYLLNSTFRFIKSLVSGAYSQCAIQGTCLLYTSPSPRDRQKSRMPSSA